MPHPEPSERERDPMTPDPWRDAAETATEDIVLAGRSADPVPVPDVILSAFLDLRAEHEALQQRLAAAEEAAVWRPIETAPKGEVIDDVGCRGSSEWFIGLHRSGREAKIKRLPTMFSFSFADEEDTRYSQVQFTHWRPLPRSSQ